MILWKYIEMCENSKYRVGSGTRKFFRNRDGYLKISKFSNLSGFSKESGLPKELGFRKGLVTRINNSLKPTPSTISKCRRSRTIRIIPSVISFAYHFVHATNFTSIQFLVHVLMFECICFKWRNKPVVFTYLVLNSWWQCMDSAFVSSSSWKCSQTELLFTFFLYTISSALLPATTTLLSLSLDIFFKIFLIFIKFTQILNKILFK